MRHSHIVNFKFLLRMCEAMSVPLPPEFHYHVDNVLIIPPAL